MIRTRLALACAALGGLAAAPAAAQPGWDKAKAAAYLDRQAAAWLDTNGSQLATGKGTTACVCCHTTAAYAVARPALRKSLGAASPDTDVTARVVANTRLRVDNWATNQQMYEGDPKTKESRGTEAVLNALILAGTDAAAGATTPSEHTRKAFKILWDEQLKGGPATGSWDWLRFPLEPWETDGARYYGAALAAWAVAAAPGYVGANLPDADRQGVDRLRAYLKGRLADQNLYNRTWALIADAKLGGVLTDAQKQETITALRGKRLTGAKGEGWNLSKFGPWRWNGGKDLPASPNSPAPKAAVLDASDGYATAVVIFALRQAGVPADDPDVQAAAKWLKGSQQVADPASRVYGAFPGHSINKDRDLEAPAPRGRFMTDAATAFAALALLACE